jgi:hypothetical protein
MPKDPALEHIDALGGQPFQAFRGQDHRAHITSHLSFMSTNIAKNNPMIVGSLEKNIFEHISLMALEQVEFRICTRITTNTNDVSKSSSFTGSTDASTGSTVPNEIRI